MVADERLIESTMDCERKEKKNERRGSQQGWGLTWTD